jgi:vacuolar-type H+-ATPase subunit H
MAETEVNVINHLLDVEHQASEMISGAQSEADKRIAAFRAQAETGYKKQYDEIISELESTYKTGTENIINSHIESIRQYKSDIQNIVPDKQSFNKQLDVILFPN